MSTFSKLQRNITYKTYIIDILFSFVLALLSSNFIYFPLLIGIFITLDLRLSFVLPFLFFTEITHGYLYLSLISFYFIYKYYIYPIFSIKLDKNYIHFLSIPLVYILYFLFLESYYTINDIFFNINYLFILYYILVEELLLLIDKRLK